jgi:Tol biopolymer transport system component
MRWGLFVMLAACHAKLADPSLDPDAHPQPGTDTGIPILGDAPMADAMLGMFSTPMAIPNASNSANSIDDCTMSWSGTELVYAVQTNGTGNKHLYTMSYTAGMFGTPQLLPFSGVVDDESPRFSPDDLTLYFASTRGGASLDIYSTHRTAVGAMWQTPQVVSGPNTAKTDKWYAPCGGTHYVVVGTSAAGDSDLYEGIVGAAPQPISNLNSTQNDTSAFLTTDCLTLYFASTRGTSTDIYVSHRGSVNAVWEMPSLVAPFDTADNEEDPWMSPDQRTFVFARSTTANPLKSLYISTR